MFSKKKVRDSVFWYQCYVVNRVLDFSRVCEAFDIPLCADKGNNHAQCFCPFHVNVNTPAAMLYRNDEHEDVVWCFAENKRFTCSDLFINNVIRIPLESVFEHISHELAPNVIDSLRREYLDRQNLTDNASYLSKRFQPLMNFKLGRMDYQQYCEALYVLLDDK